MKKISCIVLALSLSACAAQQQQSTLVGPEAAASLEAFVRDVFDHFGKGDFAYMKNSMCEQAIVFDLDENGTPIAKRGKAEVDAMIDHYQQLMSTPGAGTSATLQRIDCRADGSAFCTVELDQTFSMGGETVGPLKFRATIVAKQHAGKWIWTHWHASFRENPAVSAMAAAAAPPAPEAPPSAATTPAAPSAPPPAP
jgi:ketosteroid isomerase-like protein